MCHLLTDHSSYVQKTAYRFLNIAAKKRTEYLVVEASLDVDSGPKIELPEELIAILQHSFDGIDSETWWQQQVQSCALIFYTHLKRLIECSWISPRMDVGFRLISRRGMVLIVRNNQRLIMC